MKKVLLSVICLLALSVSYLQASGGPSFGQYQDVNSYGVDISTVVFSTMPVQAFIGTGIVYGARSSTVTSTAYFDVFDTTNTPKSPAWTDPNFKFRICLTTASPVFSNTYENTLAKPVRFYRGCWWQFSDNTANSAGLYYTDFIR